MPDEFAAVASRKILRERLADWQARFDRAAECFNIDYYEAAEAELSECRHDYVELAKTIQRIGLGPQGTRLERECESLLTLINHRRRDAEFAALDHDTWGESPQEWQEQAWDGEEAVEETAQRLRTLVGELCGVIKLTNGSARAAGEDAPDEHGYVRTPADPAAYIPASVALREHTPTELSIEVKDLGAIVEDYDSNRVRWTRPLGATGEPRRNRRSVHLGDWHAFVARRRADDWPQTTPLELGVRKAAVRHARGD